MEPRKMYVDAVQKMIAAELVRNDANATLFTTAQLTGQEAAFIAFLRSNLEAPRLMSPILRPAGEATYSFTVYGSTNGATQSADGTVITPSDLAGTNGTLAIVNLRDSWTLTDNELSQAGLAGVPLETFGATSVARNLQTRIDQYAMVGDGTRLGLLNATGTSTVVVAASGSGASALWSTKTGAQMLQDLVDVVEGMKTASSGAHLPTHVVIGADRLALSKTTYTANSLKSVYEAFGLVYPGVQLVGTYYMNNTPVTVTTLVGKLSQRIVAVENSPENFGNVIGMPPSIMGVDFAELSAKYQAKARASGCAVRRPLSVCIGLPASGGI